MDLGVTIYPFFSINHLAFEYVKMSMHSYYSKESYREKIYTYISPTFKKV